MVAARIAQILLKQNPTAAPAEWEHIVEEYLKASKIMQQSILGTAKLETEEIQKLNPETIFEKSKKIILKIIRERIRPS